MEVVLTIRSDADLREQRAYGDLTVTLFARDNDYGYEYHHTWAVRPDDKTEPGDLDRLVVETFKNGLCQFGFGTYEDYDGKERYKRHSCETLLDRFSQEPVGECESWVVDKRPRKRRWGYISMRARIEWVLPLPFAPSAYFNPAEREILDLGGVMFFDYDEERSSFADEWSGRRIAEGIAAAETTLAFFNRMAKLYSERAGSLPRASNGE